MGAFYASHENSSCSYPTEVVDNPVEKQSGRLCSGSGQAANRLRAVKAVPARTPQTVCNPHCYPMRKLLMCRHFL
jgi:hypothetical protein